MAEILILGAGIAGISAAWHARRAGRKAVVFEAEKRYGGLLDHFQLDGYRFDRAVHFAFSNNEPFREVLALTDCIKHYPEPFNYEKGSWLKHPVQNNLYPLPAAEKVEAIASFIRRPRPEEGVNYRQWLTAQFGEVIAGRFPARYTLKYWTVPAENLSTEWIGNRLYRPSLEEVLLGAMTEKTPSTYYLPEMLYPRRGGFRSILDPLVAGLDLRYGKKAVRVNPAKGYVECADGSREYYGHLISSIPLPELAAMIEGTPPQVEEAARKLVATSVALVSVGLDSLPGVDYSWFYIYDRDILPARVHAPHRKSPDNAPAGRGSLQFEIYFSPRRPLELSPESLVEHVLGAAEKMKLFEKGAVKVADCRILPLANVVFEQQMTVRRDYVLEHVKGLGIIPIGRFGEWDYLWADQCFLSGGNVESLPGMV